jgi:hypothetical protein
MHCASVRAQVLAIALPRAPKRECLLSRSVLLGTGNDVMRITTFNQIFGMLAVSRSTTLSVFGATKEN